MEDIFYEKGETNKKRSILKRYPAIRFSAKDRSLNSVMEQLLLHHLLLQHFHEIAPNHGARLEAHLGTISRLMPVT